MSHWEQPNGSYLVRVYSCFLNQSTWCQNLKLHRAQLNGSSLVWVFHASSIKALDVGNLKSHSEQPKGLSVNGSSLVWVISCVFSIYLPIRDRYNLRAGFFFHNNNNKRWCCSSARKFHKSTGSVLKLTRVGKYMVCSSTWCGRLKVTQCAAVWFIHSVDFSMPLQSKHLMLETQSHIQSSQGFYP